MKLLGLALAFFITISLVHGERGSTVFYVDEPQEQSVGDVVGCITASTILATEIGVFASDIILGEVLYSIQAGFYSAAEIFDIYFACTGVSSDDVDLYFSKNPSSPHARNIQSYKSIISLVQMLSLTNQYATNMILEDISLRHASKLGLNDALVESGVDNNSPEICSEKVTVVYDDVKDVISNIENGQVLWGIRNSLWTVGDAFNIYFNCTHISEAAWEKAIREKYPKSTHQIYECADGMKNSYDSFKGFILDLATGAAPFTTIETIITLLNNLQSDLPLCETVANAVLGTHFNTVRTDNILGDLSHSLTLFLDNYPIPPPRKTKTLCNEQLNATYSVVSDLIQSWKKLDLADILDNTALFVDEFAADKMNCGYTDWEIMSLILYQFLGDNVQYCISNVKVTVDESMHLYNLYEKGGSTAKIIYLATQLLAQASDTIADCVSLI